jgi:hypothetical protein
MLLPERRAQLDALGFVWDVLEARWEDGFRCLEHFHRREGHCRVPDKHREQGYRLGAWVSNQRTAQDKLAPDRRARLDALGFVWDVLADQWEEGFRFLELFRQREGHCRVPTAHRDPVTGFRLGGWVSERRKDQATMPPERRQRLDALGFVWNVLEDRWEDGFRCLELFRLREGHCRVPKRYRDPATGFRLGRWVDEQRTTKETMLPARHARLDALGFEWKVR